jgi:hypothetical protein
MTYGIRTFDSSGTNITLDISNKTIRLAATVPVTSPSSGTTTVNISTAAPTATVSNTIAVLENGAATTVNTTGQVVLETAYFDTAAKYTTKLRVFVYE